ncbi:MAG: DUF4097 family beta strand repeat-containing protein [Myxococcales bacterium]
MTVTASAKKLVLNNDFGAIKVVGEAGRTEIDMKPTLKSSDPEAGTIDVLADGESMLVQVNNSSGGTIAVDVTIYTPKELSFTVNTGGGNLDLTGMTGSGIANTKDGDCTIDMDLGTSGSLTVNTLKGDIKVTVPATTKGDLSASATAGTLTVSSNLNLDTPVYAGMGSGSLNGGGDASITLSSTSGNISVSGK